MGFATPLYPARKFLFFILLAVLASVNRWVGIQVNFSFAEALCYVGSMVLVGILEALVFRGFLFKAMSKNNVKMAIVVSSITFLSHLRALFLLRRRVVFRGVQILLFKGCNGLFAYAHSGKRP